MNLNNLTNIEKIEKLRKIIQDKKIENNELKLKEILMQEQTQRYQEIYNNSYLSIWEENPTEVYHFFESLPCKTGMDLKKYLTEHIDILIQLISKLQIIEINSYTVQLFGASYKTQFLKALNEGKILTPEAFPGFIEIFAAILDKKSYCKTEITTYSLNGEKLKLLVTSYIPGKNKGNLLISMMDITGRKNKEEALSSSISLVSEQRKRSEVLQRILLTLNSSLDKEIILNDILLEVKKIVPYSSANIRIREEEHLNVVAAVGYGRYGASEVIRTSSILTKDFGDVESYLNSGKINIIPDVTEYPGWRTFPATSYIRAYIGIPFEWNGEISGLISLDSDKTNAFSESDIEKLEPFAHAVTVAIQSFHLFETRKKELEKRKIIENSIKKSLEDKEILLKEIHHRVKNNLALVMSLINLQSDMVSNNINPIIFEDLKQRVYTISLVHEMLYNSKNLSSVELKSYLIDLTSTIMGSSFFKHGIKFQINIRDNIEVEADIIVPLALMLNELIINSVKHAFPDNAGTISINVSISKAEYKIVIKDDGIGFPEDKKKSTSILGLDLVESMISQINGTVDFKNDSGAVVTIVFPHN